MTSWSRVKIKGREVIVKLGGYNGKSETTSPIGDIMHANRAWVPKDTARALKLKIGQRVTLNISGTTVRGKVYRWSRGSREIIFDHQLHLPRSAAEKIHVDID